MDNLEIYDAVREVPQTAQKTIQGGRLKGMTDINPMWRIKVLTEQFGACGIGWKYEIVDKRLETGANDEIVAVTDINLYIKYGDSWSEAIPGTGGSMFVAKERSGLYTSDEAYKMALTDALSVACKALGVGADIYWQADRSKYSDCNDSPKADNTESLPKKSASRPKLATSDQMSELRILARDHKVKLPDVLVQLQADKKIDGHTYKADGKAVLSALDYAAVKAHFADIPFENKNQAS